MISNLGLGNVLHWARDYEQSIIYYREAVELEPHFDGVHTDLACSYEELGRFDDAMAEYEKASGPSGVESSIHGSPLRGGERSCKRSDVARLTR